MIDGVLPASTRIDIVRIGVPKSAELAGFYSDVIGFPRVDVEAGRVRCGTDDRLLLELVDVDRERRTHEAGLYHIALRVPGRAALGEALERVTAAGSLEGASDHGFSEAVYAHDPVGTGIELYRDRPRDAWPRTADGTIRAITEAADRDALQNAARDRSRLPPETRVGHVHLAVGDVDRSISFYRGRVGFGLTMRPDRSVAFLAAGDYHHHVAVNTWEGRSVRTTPIYFHWEIIVPNRAALEAVADRMDSADTKLYEGDGLELVDPDGIGIGVHLP